MKHLNNLLRHIIGKYRVIADIISFYVSICYTGKLCAIKAWCIKYDTQKKTMETFDIYIKCLMSQYSVLL